MPSEMVFQLCHEDGDEGSALKSRLEADGQTVKVMIVKSPFAENIVAERIYSQLIENPTSAVSHLDVKIIGLKSAFFIAHNAGFTATIICEPSSDGVLNVLQSAKLSGFFAYATTRDGEHQMVA